MARNPERRTALVDAAIEVLARDGARGLTFRAVDVEAGVPAGTATNYFSTRDDLIHQVGRRIHVRLELDTATQTAAQHAAPSRQLAEDLMRALFHRIVEQRTGYLALLELRLEATRRPELRASLTETIAANHERDVRGHQDLGLPGDRTSVLLLYLAMNGLITEQLTLPGMLAGRDLDDLVGALVRQLVPVE